MAAFAKSWRREWSSRPPERQRSSRRFGRATGCAVAAMKCASGRLAFDLSPGVTGRIKFNGINESCNLFLNRNRLKMPKSCNRQSLADALALVPTPCLWLPPFPSRAIPDHRPLVHTSISGTLSG
jgi:hypothetical protein